MASMNITECFFPENVGNTCLWYTLFQGGLKAVVWTDVFQVGTDLSDLWVNLEFN